MAIGDAPLRSTGVADGSIKDVHVASDAAIAPSKIAGTAVVNSDSRLSDHRLPQHVSIATQDVIVVTPLSEANPVAQVAFPVPGGYLVDFFWASRHEVNNGKYDFHLRTFSGDAMVLGDMEAGYGHTESVRWFFTITGANAVWARFWNKDTTGNLVCNALQMTVSRLT